MQNFPVAARALPFVLIFLVAGASAQSTARHQSSIKAETPISILKVNKRPDSPVENSIRSYEKILKSNPNDPVVLNNLAASYFLAGRLFEAQSLLRRAVQRSPESTQLRVNLAIVLSRTYNPGLAIETLEGVLKQEPQLARARSILCELYGQEKRSSDAISCYEILERTGHLSSVDAANYGTALLDKGEFDQALSMLRRADAKFPDNPGIKNGLGVAFFMKKKYSTAETHLIRAVELEPDAAQLRYNLAMTQIVTNKRGSVLEQYKFLKTSDPELASQLYKHLFRGKIVSVKPQ